MNKKRSLIILLFFLCVIFALEKINICDVNFLTKKAYAEQCIQKNIVLKINLKENLLDYKLSMIDNSSSDFKKGLIDKQNIVNIVNNLKHLNFSEEEISKYLYPELDKIYSSLENKFIKQERRDEIYVYKNACKLKILEGEFGEFINKEMFFKEFLNQLLKEKNEIILDLEIEKYKKERLDKNDFLKRSEFSTQYSTSSKERKNNIKVALKSFDGIILNEGETLSFNNTTGQRNKESGYLPAKIISGGTFIEGYGGGVCQVSTTLYNACILAGLDILEVHSHSLPVSYIEPSFDAMVNQGSSDLVVRNNTGGKIVITTSSNGDECKVAIFGKENNYKIEKVSKKTKTIEANNEEIIETDCEKYGLNDLEVGQEKKISYAKDGFFSEGYLKYYDRKGKLVKTQKIRESKYNPTKGITVRKEN